MSTPGYESRIAFGDAATFEDSSTWTEFANVIELTPPKLETDTIESSHMLTPGQIKSYLPGWAEPGEIEATIEFEKEQMRTVYDLFRLPKGFRIEFNDAPHPSGSKLYADGFIKSVGQEIDREGLVTVPIVIQCNGQPEFEEAA